MGRRALPTLVALVALLGMGLAACADDDAGEGAVKVYRIGADPFEGNAPLEVSFGINLDPGNSRRSELVFEWDFGDGTTSSEEEPTHTYLQEGVYEVEATVAAPDGSSDSASDRVTVGAATTPPTTTTSQPDEQAEEFDVWIEGTNEACIDAADSVDDVAAEADDPFGPEVVQASLDATLDEKAAIDALPVPEERAEEVRGWIVAHHELADYFIEAASDAQISTEEGAELQRRSLELLPLSEGLGLTGCIGDGG